MYIKISRTAVLEISLFLRLSILPYAELPQYHIEEDMIRKATGIVDAVEQMERHTVYIYVEHRSLCKKIVRQRCDADILYIPRFYQLDDIPEVYRLAGKQDDQQDFPVCQLFNAIHQFPFIFQNHRPLV